MTTDVRGYVAVFGREYVGGDDGQIYRIKAGAFRVNSGLWQLWLAHEQPERAPLASVRAGSLTIFADDYGLGFSANIDDETGRLHEEIASGRLTGMSLGGSINSTSHIAADGVREFTQFEVEEISLAYNPRNPLACCWLADAWELSLNETQRAARRRYNFGRQSSHLAARISPLRNRAAAIPASVTELLRKFEADEMGLSPPKPVPPGVHEVYEDAQRRHPQSRPTSPRSALAARPSPWAPAAAFFCALSAGDASTIASWVKLHGGASTGLTDTNCVATWIRSRWGGTGTDAAVIALYGGARADTDLLKWAASLRRSGAGVS